MEGVEVWCAEPLAVPFREDSKTHCVGGGTRCFTSLREWRRLRPQDRRLLANHHAVRGFGRGLPSCCGLPGAVAVEGVEVWCGAGVLVGCGGLGKGAVQGP